MQTSGPSPQRLVASIALACLLASCGGGGGDSPSAASNSSGNSSAGSGGNVSDAAPAPAPAGDSGSSAVLPSGTQAATGVFISEVANNFYNNSVSWFEVVNNSGAPIDLANYQVRSAAINTITQATKDTVTFQLPSLVVQPQSYVVVSARANTDLQSTDSNVYIGDALNWVPYWQGSNGFMELLSAGKTVDFMRFGSNTTQPTTASAWTGQSVAAMGSTSDSYNTSLVRLTSSFKQTRSASDWTQVGFSTPGGPNDVPPGAVDSDGDGIPDTAKVAGGTYSGLDLYAMGARRGQRDIFIQVDYMDSTDPGVTPNVNALNKVVEAFRKQNIAVHFDAGNLYASGVDSSKHNLSGNVSNKRAFSACTRLASPSLVNAGCSSAYTVKSLNMDIRRKPVFRYLLMANSQNILNAAMPTLVAGPSGTAEILGDDFLVTLGGWNLKADSQVLVNYQASTIMHELGHTLGLQHGGDEDVNNKPNYYSVMNYFYQLTGLPSPVGPGVSQRYYYFQSNYASTSVPGYLLATTYPENKIDEGAYSANFKLDYSDGKGASLNENSLTEFTLIGRGSDSSNFADWNLNNAANSSAVANDINNSGSKTVLNDYNDWGNLVLNSRRYFYANNSGAQAPGGLSLLTAAVNPITHPFQPTIQEAPPLAALIKRLLLGI